MKLLLVKSERWKPTLTLPATAGLRDLVGWEKSSATADEGPVRRQDPEGVAACSKRFYPVYSFSLILLLWRICHNGKGKAKSVIILMDLP